VSSRPQRWLSIVGIGEDGVDGLSPIARLLVSDAELVLGGKRHLALADPLIKSQRLIRSKSGRDEDHLMIRGAPNQQ